MYVLTVIDILYELGYIRMHRNLSPSPNSWSWAWGFLYSFFYIENKKFHFFKVSFILPHDHWFLHCLCLTDPFEFDEISGKGGDPNTMKIFEIVGRNSPVISVGCVLQIIFMLGQCWKEEFVWLIYIYLILVSWEINANYVEYPMTCCLDEWFCDRKLLCFLSIFSMISRFWLQ